MSAINTHSCLEFKYKDHIEKHIIGINPFGIILLNKELIPHNDNIEQTEIRIWIAENIPTISKAIFDLKYKGVNGSIEEVNILTQEEMNEIFN